MDDTSLSISSVDKKDCQGCLACTFVCPTNCIEKIVDDVGFPHPQINAALCICCSRCVKVCPRLNDSRKNEIDSSYIAVSSNLKNKLSSSGGIASAFAAEIIRQGGSYYGVSADSTGVKLKRITSSQDIWKAQGSAYIQADMLIVLSDLLDDLKQGVACFLCATPCICAAIENIINLIDRKLRSNLYIASFPCGGWSSEKMLQDESRAHIDADLTWDKYTSRKGHLASSFFFKGQKCLKKIFPSYSMLTLAFGAKISIRDSCTCCNFCTPQRIGDLLIGDWWTSDGVNLDCEKTLNVKKGQAISILGILTPAGNELVQRCVLNQTISCQKKPMSAISAQNQRLSTTWLEDKAFSSHKYKKFMQRYSKRGLHYAVWRTIPITVITWRTKDWLKKIYIRLTKYDYFLEKTDLD